AVTGIQMNDPFSGDVISPAVRRRAQARFHKNGVRLPLISELSDPQKIARWTINGLTSLDPDAADPQNLFRVHWFNAADRRGRASVPEHAVLPRELTGTDARIIVALG